MCLCSYGRPASFPAPACVSDPSLRRIPSPARKKGCPRGDSPLFWSRMQSGLTRYFSYG